MREALDMLPSGHVAGVLDFSLDAGPRLARLSGVRYASSFSILFPGRRAWLLSAIPAAGAGLGAFRTRAKTL